MPFKIVSLMTSDAGVSSSWVSDALNVVWPIIQKGFEMMTTPPLSYYLVIGLVMAALGIIGYAKHTAR